jgi:hypothetical protein
MEIVTFLPIVARQVCLVRLLADGLIYRIFHHTQPRGTFAQQVSVFLRGSQWPSNTPQDFPLKLSNNFRGISLWLSNTVSSAQQLSIAFQSISLRLSAINQAICTFFLRQGVTILNINNPRSRELILKSSAAPLLTQT